MEADEVVFKKKGQQSLPDIRNTRRNDRPIGGQAIRDLHLRSHPSGLRGRERLGISEQDLILGVEKLDRGRIVLASG